MGHSSNGEINQISGVVVNLGTRWLEVFRCGESVDAINVSEGTIIPCNFEDEDNECKVKESKSNKNESEDLSTSEGSNETLMNVVVEVFFWDSISGGISSLSLTEIVCGLEGDSDVSVYGNSHTNVSSNN